MSSPAIRSAPARASKQATGISILSLVLGAAAMAAGAGDAGMGIMMAGQRAAKGEFMAFTRGQEATADASAARFLSKAGISGKGMLDFFGKLQNQEYRLGDLFEGQFRPRPPADLRADQGARARRCSTDPAWNKPTDPALEARFQRVKAKLMGYVDPKLAVIKYPESDQSVPAHYARAYAYHLGGYPGQGQCRGRRAARDRPARSLFPRAQGPDPARGRQAARRRSRRFARRCSGRATRR